MKILIEINYPRRKVLFFKTCFISLATLNDYNSVKFILLKWSEGALRKMTRAVLMLGSEFFLPHVLFNLNLFEFCPSPSMQNVT